MKSCYGGSLSSQTQMTRQMTQECREGQASSAKRVPYKQGTIVNTLEIMAAWCYHISTLRNIYCSSSKV
eukprot:g66937.t1